MFEKRLKLEIHGSQLQTSLNQLLLQQPFFRETSEPMPVITVLLNAFPFSKVS